MDYKQKKPKKQNWNDVHITNGLLFKYVMKNKPLCKKVIESILNVPIREIVYQEEEKEIDLTL